MNRRYCQLLSNSRLKSVKYNALCLFSIPFLALAMVLWLLNPYICCPQDTTSPLSAGACQAVDYQSSMSGSDDQTGINQAANSATIIQNYLAKGTPKSLPDTTPSFVNPISARTYQELWVANLTLANDKPTSALVIPQEYPPSV